MLWTWYVPIGKTMKIKIENVEQKIACLVSQSKAFVQLDEDFAVLASISGWIRLYKCLNFNGLDEYFDSSLCSKVEINYKKNRTRTKKKKSHRWEIVFEENIKGAKKKNQEMCIITQNQKTYQYVIANIRFYSC